MSSGSQQEKWERKGQELVEEESQYIQDLEALQTYVTVLSLASVNSDISRFSSSLGLLLPFHRRFLTTLKNVAEQPWQDQQWGVPFIENAASFKIYEPYYIQYTLARDALKAIESFVKELKKSMKAEPELSALIIKPIHRLSDYSMALKGFMGLETTIDYTGQLVQGSKVIENAINSIGDVQRRRRKQEIADALVHRISDWKGHSLPNLGELLHDEILTATKSNVDRHYEVYLFEKIILCCKQSIPSPDEGQTNQETTTPAQSDRRTTPLLLKGRIFLNNVNGAVPRIIKDPPMATKYDLAISWEGDEGLETMTLHFKAEWEMRDWAETINGLIERRRVGYKTKMQGDSS